MVYFLQVTAPIEKGIDKLFDTYILFGVLGILLMVAGYSIYKLFNINEKLRITHSEEVKEMNNKLLEKSEKSVVLLEKSTDLLSKFPETLSREQKLANQELVAEIKRVIDEQAKEIKALKCLPNNKNRNA